MLPTIQLAKTTLQPSILCLGTADWGTKEADDFRRVYAAFREAGGNCFDSAHCYAFWRDKGGISERSLGQCVRENNDRANVLLCTKGCHVTGGPRYPRPDQYMTAAQLASDLAESLDRLGTDCIDLYFLHRDDPRVPPDEILGALHEQQQAGRIRFYAASNWRPQRLAQAEACARARGYTGFVASQILFNLGKLSRPTAPDICAMDEGQTPYYQQSQLPIFAFSSTANGHFAAPRTGGGYDNETTAGRLARCQQLARELGATANQVALAWLRHQPFPVVPIIGTMRLAHLQDALSAAQVKLTAQQVGWLRDGV